MESAPQVISATAPINPATDNTRDFPTRLGSLDAYRGFVMFLMMAEALHLSRVSASNPDSAFWKFLAYHQSHVEWIGCSLHI